MPEPDEATRELQDAAWATAENLHADILTISGGMYSPADDKLIDLLGDQAKKSPLRQNVLIFLTTTGGQADVAYRMARCLRSRYSSGGVYILVDTYCKSAGTLLALGANDVIMTEHAQLGPLDVQFYKPDELGEFISGLTPVQTLQFLRKQAFEHWEHCFLELLDRSGRQITTKTAADIAAGITTGLLAGIYAQLDPLKLGDYHRNMQIAEEYGNRIDAGNLRPGALHRLTYGYPSHDFVIDREEAETLFKCVRPPTNEEEKLLGTLTETIAEDFRRARPAATLRFIPTPPKTQETGNAEASTE